jgi:hypothetical protein
MQQRLGLKRILMFGSRGQVAKTPEQQLLIEKPQRADTIIDDGICCAGAFTEFTTEKGFGWGQLSDRDLVGVAFCSHE